MITPTDIPIDDYLQNIVSNSKFSQQTRDLAQRTLERWNLGIIPGEKVLRKLSKETMPPEPCIRIGHDGSCGWLRKHGTNYKLVVPPPGEKAMCCYKDVYNNCPGYKK
jgi:hypothetical protein